ncbi:MAG TPA: YbhB/YbcL family Raf kinase inhibitor-like protein [Acidimicrobiales bacterium]|nr:YbhB/YbcL family Raf kinase inhibitor-like protein [Acidimicrobiales bacterium]
MPTPGSNKYDERLHRLRKRFVDEGHSDEDAERLAKEALADEVGGPNPASITDRAAGPLGGSGGGGDPGNVVTLRSPAFSSDAPIPPRYTKVGDNVSPALEWDELPAGTAEVALVCEDPDAPGGTFLHWLVTGIDPDVTAVPEGAEPPGGTAWQNGFGDRGYDGPLPPVGDDPHRYFFRLFALAEPLDTGDGDDPSAVRHALDRTPHLVTGTLVGTFER